MRSWQPRSQTRTISFLLGHHFLFSHLPVWSCISVRGACNFLGSVSSQQKFEATDGPVLQLSDRPVLQLRVTAQFYLENKGNTCPRCWPKRQKEKRGPRPNFGFSFYMFFLLSLGLPYVNWASQECCLFYLRSSLHSSDLPLFYFRGLILSLYFSHCHSGLIFPILTT